MYVFEKKHLIPALAAVLFFCFGCKGETSGSSGNVQEKPAARAEKEHQQPEEVTEKKPEKQWERAELELPPEAGEQTWAFEPVRDEFSDESLLDLRFLNEKEAGETGWISYDSNGDFIKGDGTLIRFWGVHDDLATHEGAVNRPLWKEQDPDPERHARWLAKLGVNFTRIMTYISPPKGSKNMDADMKHCEAIWRHVAVMKKEGIYTMITPYRGSQTDFGLSLFFDPELQEHHRKWLRVLFRTKTPILGGRCLAEEPALAVYQIQNENNLLFYGINNINPKNERMKMLGCQYAKWVLDRYSSYEKAFKAWNGHKEPADDPDAGILDFANNWHATLDARRQNSKQTQRINDQIQFLTEVQYAFHKSIDDFVHNELKCPVLISATNWRTVDPILVGDADRYSYTANQVLDAHRYFGGIHTGKYRGWAIIKDDEYTSDSALLDAPVAMPINVKQGKGKPFVMSESSWVFPNEHAAEGPFLISVYSSLTGFDAYCWFASSTETWIPPRSANGFLPSQAKWICLTPDTAGQFPAAALVFRRMYIKRGEPVLEEHRSLKSIYERKNPMIAESASYDPNMDKGDMPADSKFDSGVSPYAFFAGPVEVVYDSSETNTRIHPKLASLIKDTGPGKEVTSITGEIVLNTDKGFCTVDTPRFQGVTAHFANRDRFDLSDVSIRSGNDFGTVMLVSMDGKPITSSAKILVQVGTQCRPKGWKTEPVTVKPEGGKPVEGKKVVDYGTAPWQVECPRLTIQVRNYGLSRMRVLDMSGLPVSEEPIENGVFTFPLNAMYVVLE